MQRDQVIALLRGAAVSGDDWYRLDEVDGGTFQVADGSGAAALVAVEEHWAEVRAGRPLGPGSHPIPVTAPGSLLRAVLQPGDPPALLLRGRIYLDGFSLHALYCTVRDVLQAAGPLAATADRAAGADDLATLTEGEGWEPEREDASDEQPAAGEEAITETSASLEQPVQLGAFEAFDDTYTPATGVSEVADEVDAAQPSLGDDITVTVDEAEELPPETEAPPEEPAAIPPRLDTPVAGTPLAAGAGAAAAPAPAGPPSVAPLTSSVGATVQMSRSAMQEALAAAPPAADPPMAPAVDSRQICRRCGAQVEAGERFCINCGAPQPSADAPPPAAAADVPPLRRSTEPETVAWRRPSADVPDAPETAASAQPTPSASARCGRCGYENPPGNRFCQGCGSALAAV